MADSDVPASVPKRENLDRQLDGIPVDKTVADKVSVKTTQRPKPDDYVREGDTGLGAVQCPGHCVCEVWAMSPGRLWSPVRRCRMALSQSSSDSGSEWTPRFL